MLNRNIPGFLLILHLAHAKIINHDQICGNFVGRRVYLELGEKGYITSNNVIKISDQYASTFRQCRIEIVTCPSCVISLNFVLLNISRNCGVSQNESCECGYVWLYEPQYKDLSGKRFCNFFENRNQNAETSYKSITRTVVVSLFYNYVSSHSFSLAYSATHNRITRQHHPEDPNKTYSVSSPFFPHPYPQDLNMEYLIVCKNEENCVIRLVFDDFLIGRMSVIEFLDWRGQRINATTGMVFRPTTIVSSGPRLTIRFYANQASGIGFKASYSFKTVGNGTSTINMGCGGLVDNLGGGITMMHVVKIDSEAFDCVWIVLPSAHFSDFYTHLRVSVVSFIDFGEDVNLLIRTGITSNGHQSKTNTVEHTVLISQGFYVRLSGKVRPESNLAIAYNAFSSRDCTAGTDFSCKNQRCVPIFLQCDGFDHCGDNSDEPSSCFQDLKDRRWFHTTNFFFPKTEKDAEFNSAALIFVICSFGLVSLIFALSVFIFRLTGRGQSGRETQDHLRIVISEDEGSSIVEEEVAEDDPPNYEAPPNYSELSKGKLVSQENQKEGVVSVKVRAMRRNSCGRCSLTRTRPEPSTSTDAPTTQSRIPESPPPLYSSFTATPADVGNDVSGTSPVVQNSASTRSFNRLLKKLLNEEYNSLKNAILGRLARSSEDCIENSHISKERRCLSDGNLFESMDVNQIYKNRRRIFNKALMRRHSFSNSL